MSTRTASPARTKRWLILITSSFVVLLLAVALLFPYLLKRYIESHSEQWIGRKVTIGSIVLNPLTFRYAVNEVVCYEPQSDEVFVSWSEISVRSNLWAGFRANHWRFRGLRITEPYVHIVQRGDRFNFSDLMELGGAATDTAATASSVRFSMEDIHLTGGRVDYISDILATPVGIHELNATSNIISSEQARMEFGLGFVLNDGGRLDGGFVVDTEVERYGIKAHLKSFALSQLLPYLQDLFQCKALEGALDLDLDLVDSYKDTTSLAISAALDVRGLKLTDPNNEKLFSLERTRAQLDTLVAKEQRVEMGEVVLDGADLKFVMLADGTDNWTRLLKLDPTAVSGTDSVSTQLQASESNVFLMLADYISYLGEQIVASDYTAKKLALTNSAVHFEDNTPAQPFRYAISAINVSANRITSDQEAGRVSASAVLQETGTLKGDAVFDPKNIRNVTVDLTVDRLALNHLDAYGRWYAAHPLEDGLLQYVTKTVVQDGMIDSQNHLRVDKLKVGKKVDEHDPEIYVLPLRLAAGLLKDVDGVVELDVPVKGDLNDPEFKVWPIVWQVLKNLIVKAATAPGRLLMRAFEGADEEDLERVRFDYLQPGPARSQEKTLKQLVSALRAKPELTVDLVSIVDTKAEAKEVAVFQVKKAFLLPDKSTLEGADSVRIAQLSVRDSAFIAYVDGRTVSMAGKSVHDRCLALLGAAEADRIAAEIEYARRENTMQLLLANGMDPARVRYRDGTPEELAGQRGVPGFRFVYDVGE
ncbi:MAG: DUF748 domain-containing protein [Flavobacteriales bacterium]|nr:MAG: DUF748 domain-containing protein [Flavobacteriales bacterium]